MFAIRNTLKSGAAWIVVGFTSFVGVGLATAGGVLWLAEWIPIHAALGVAGLLWVLLPLAVALHLDRKKRLAEAPPSAGGPHYGTLLLAASAGLAMAQGKTEDAAILFRELDPK